MKKLVNEQEILDNLRFLNQLGKSFPTQEDAMTEIVNLSSILALPKSTEHFMSDIHGEYDKTLLKLMEMPNVICLVEIMS